jgi:hypothetical protein
MNLKLTASNPTEQRVLDYLAANASDVLAEKINAGAKTLGGALRYCRDEARKLKNDGDSVCVDDQTVFGWTVHYFEEDALDEEEKPKAPKVTVPAGVKVDKPKKHTRESRKTRKSTVATETPETVEEAPAPVQEAAPVVQKKPDQQLSLFQEVLDGGNKA